MDWDHLRFVLAVAEAGGVSAAARALGVDAGTVSRRLDATEASLRCKLFHRTRRGLTPTEAGTKLIAPARRIAAEIGRLDLELSAEDRGLAGPVVITATEAVAAGFLAPILPGLRMRHPGIVVELVTDIRTLDLGRREADIALRLVRPRLGDLSVRRLGEVGYGLYAAARYVEARGMPDLEVQAAGHDVIDWPLDYTIIPQVPWLRRLVAAAPVVMRSGSAVARQAACAEGLGLALLPCVLADADPRLQRVPTRPAPVQELWLVTHRDLARMPRIRVVLDFVATEARRARARLRGRR
ncbi:MAG: LysR family transcriptional regulator [Alphaproteobacteria bacterium]|nr:LysR family transcriptional regulator [Alphaproteobacteria bacterium]